MVVGGGLGGAARAAETEAAGTAAVAEVEDDDTCEVPYCPAGGGGTRRAAACPHVSLFYEFPPSVELSIPLLNSPPAGV